MCPDTAQYCYICVLIPDTGVATSQLLSLSNLSLCEPNTPRIRNALYCSTAVYCYIALFVEIYYGSGSSLSPAILLYTATYVSSYLTLAVALKLRLYLAVALKLRLVDCSISVISVPGSAARLEFGVLSCPFRVAFFPPSPPPASVTPLPCFRGLQLSFSFFPPLTDGVLMNGALSSAARARCHWRKIQVRAWQWRRSCCAKSTAYIYLYLSIYLSIHPSTYKYIYAWRKIQVRAW
jgi:hypothetical protein